jgi:hypothetical protein
VSRNLVGGTRRNVMARSGPWRLVAVPDVRKVGGQTIGGTHWLDPEARRPPVTPKHLRAKKPRPGSAPAPTPRVAHLRGLRRDPRQLPRLVPGRRRLVGAPLTATDRCPCRGLLFGLPLALALWWALWRFC